MSRSMAEDTATIEPAKKSAPAVCARCRHFRSAPRQARREGCYHPDNMPQRQKDRSLDEQQIPGDHRVINRDGDCAQFEPLPPRPSFWDWLFSAR